MLQVVTKDNFKDLNRLFKKNYKNNPLLYRIEYFDWQFKENKTGQYNFFIFRQGKKIIGHIGFFPVKLKHANKVVSAVLPVNWYAQEKIVGLKLLDVILTKNDNILQFGMSKEAKIIYSLLKMPILETLPRVVAVINPKEVLKLCNVKGKIAKLIIRQSAQKIASFSQANRIKEITRFKEEDAIDLTPWKSIKNHIVKDATYLNRRYFDIPFHDYRVFHNGYQGQFVVWRSESVMYYPFSIIRILEWSIKEKVPEALSAILMAAAKDNPILFEFFCTSMEIRNELLDYGFIDPKTLEPDRIPHQFRPINHGDDICIGIDLPPHRKERKVDFNEWYITKGDGDMDRKK